MKMPFFFEDLLNVRQNSLFCDKSFSSFDSSYLQSRGYSYDLREEEGVLEVVVPGFESNQINVSVNSGIISVRAERKSGRDTVKFEREFTIPKNVDSEKISARLKNGLLRVTLPLKMPQRQEPRTIVVESE